MVFVNVMTAGLFFVVNIISVSSILKFNHCKPMDPVKRATYCFFDYNHIGESLREEQQNVTLCFKPKDSFSKLLIHHFQVKEPASYEIFPDFFHTNEWNFINVTIKYRKGNSSNDNDTIQYEFNNKTYQELILPKTLGIFEYNIGFTFLGDIEGTLNDLLPCSLPSGKQSELGKYFVQLMVACIASLLISGVCGFLALIQFIKMRKLRKDFATECQKMRNFQVAKEHIPEDLYINPNVSTKEASTMCYGIYDQMDRFPQLYNKNIAEKLTWNQPIYASDKMRQLPGIYLDRQQINETREQKGDEPYYSDIIYTISS